MPQGVESASYHFVSLYFTFLAASVLEVNPIQASRPRTNQASQGGSQASWSDEPIHSFHNHHIALDNWSTTTRIITVLLCVCACVWNLRQLRASVLPIADHGVRSGQGGSWWHSIAADACTP